MYQLQLFPFTRGGPGNTQDRPVVPCRTCGVPGRWAAADCGPCRKLARARAKTAQLRALHEQLNACCYRGV